MYAGELFGGTAAARVLRGNKGLPLIIDSFAGVAAH